MAFASPVAGSVFITPYELTESNEWPRKPAAGERFLLKGLSLATDATATARTSPSNYSGSFPFQGSRITGFLGTRSSIRVELVITE